MRSALTLLTLATFALAGACHKPQPQAQDQNIAIDEGAPAGNEIAGNADIVTLPADESSTTPSSQLANGQDNPDVNSTDGNKQ